MAEWLYEAGIGEARAALIERGQLIEMAIERDDQSPRAGAILEARLVGRDDAGRGLVELADGGAGRLSPIPPALTLGARLLVELTREPIPEAGAMKPARFRPAPADATPRAGPDLLARIVASGIAVQQCGIAGSPFDAHGWSEALEEAESGIVARPDALLRINPTPAMTLIDVDGNAPPAALAIAGARLAGETIRRFDIAGSIGVDLPTLLGRAERQVAAAALDAALPQPFERTAVNGFGFLQIIRRRVRPSVVDLLAADRPGAAVMALLRHAERAAGRGALTLVAPPTVATRIVARPDWLTTLSSRIGAPVDLRADAGLATSAGHVVRQFP